MTMSTNPPPASDATPTTGRVYLRSDFADYYDHHFEARLGNPGEVCFRRFTTDGPTRAEMFPILRRLGFAVPPWGMIATLKHIIPRDSRVVVYDDPKAHRGEGKRVMVLQDAVDTCDGRTLACVFKGAGGESIRTLKVGNRAWQMVYNSTDDWRSNVGDVSISFPRVCKPYPDDAPLSAVDVVLCEDGYPWAVDYNVAPGMRGTDMEKVLKPAEVAALIKASILKPEVSHVE
jgi:hypothetical protein